MRQHISFSVTFLRRKEDHKCLKSGILDKGFYGGKNQSKSTKIELLKKAYIECL